MGGHTKIASDLLEDVAMARLVKSAGGKVWFRYGGDAVRTRMYSNWPKMKEGWTKNLALLFSNPARLAQKRLWEFLVLLLVPLGLMRGAYSKAFLGAPNALIGWTTFLLGFACLVFIASALMYVIRLRRAGFGWIGVALGFFGLPAFAYLLWKSDHAYKSRRFAWKDRSYLYTADEVKNMTHGLSAQPRTWQRVMAWIRSGGNAGSQV